MQVQELQQRLDRIEDCVDDAKDALRGGNVPQELRQVVESLHQQARQGRTLQDEQQLRQAVMQVEETADRAMQLCRTAGQVDPVLQQAIQKAHQEASQLKHEVEDQAA